MIQKLQNQINSIRQDLSDTMKILDRINQALIKLEQKVDSLESA